MLSLSFGNRNVKRGIMYNPGDLVAKPMLTITGDKNKLYTIILYSTSSPHPDFDVHSPYLHFMAVNIKNLDLSTANILVEYLRLRPQIGVHEYILELYSQKKPVTEFGIKRREKFDLEGYVFRNELIKVDQMKFYSTPVVNTVPTNNEKLWTHNPLSESERKFCSCVLKVAAKQTSSCLRNKNWYGSENGKTCYNPYPVCAKSTGTTSRVCSDHYEWLNLPDPQLQAFANIKGLDIPSPYNREQMLSNIFAWKQAYKGK